MSTFSRVSTLLLAFVACMALWLESPWPRNLSTSHQDPVDWLPRAAFVYLVHPERGALLNRSLTSLQSNFLDLYPGYEILLFHDRDLHDYRDWVPSDMSRARWILLEDFNQFPSQYKWEPHPAQHEWCEWCPS